MPGFTDRVPGRLDPALTLLVRVAMYAVAAFSLASTIATVDEIAAFDDLVAANAGGITPDQLAAAERMSETFAGLAFWVGLLAGAATVLWWYRSYRAIASTKPMALAWSARWAVGGWFIPVANIAIPKLVLNEIDRVSQALEQPNGPWRSRRTTPIANWWWGLWVVGIGASFVGAFVVSAESVSLGFDPDAYRTGLVLVALGFAASTIAGFLGAATVRIIGERLHPSG